MWEEPRGAAGSGAPTNTPDSDPGHPVIYARVPEPGPKESDPPDPGLRGLRSHPEGIDLRHGKRSRPPLQQWVRLEGTVEGHLPSLQRLTVVSAHPYVITKR